jgi:hypothetical protein
MNLVWEIYSICATIGLVVALVLWQRRGKGSGERDGIDRLLPLLVQYQTLRQVIEKHPDLPAQQLFPLFAILDGLIEDWQLQPIGQVGEQVPFDPQHHQPDSPSLQPGDLVYIRFVGYRSGDTILTPAKVSRQLPAYALRSE